MIWQKTYEKNQTKKWHKICLLWKAIVYWMCKSDLKGEIVCFKCRANDRMDWENVRNNFQISTVVLADRRSGTVNAVFISALYVSHIRQKWNKSHSFLIQTKPKEIHGLNEIVTRYVQICVYSTHHYSWVQFRADH